MQDIQEVEALTARLRMIHADPAHSSPAQRQERLLDEIEHSLERTSPGARAALVRALLGSLPGWDSALSVAGTSPASGEPADPDADLRDPAFLVERLEEIAPALTDAQLSAVAARLGEAGLVLPGAVTRSAGADGSASGVEWPPEALARLKATLRTEGDAVPDVGRLMELAAAMAELVTKLDQLAWSTWRAMSPRAEFKRRGSTQDSMRRYLAGDPAVTREQVAEEIERLRSLSGALISTVAKVGFLAYRQVAKNAPQEIEVLAKPEKKAFESLEVACWRKYRQLAGNLDQSLIEAEVLGAMSDSVESLIRGLTRTST